MNLRTIALTGIASLAGLGLVGVGAHATFTGSADSVQTINAGTPTVVMWAANAASPCQTETNAEDYYWDCDSITLTTPSDVGSVFDAPSTIYVLNVGNIAVNLASVAVADTGYSQSGANYYLSTEMGLCIQDVNGYVADGALDSYFTTSDITPISLPTYGSETNLNVDLYAGETSSFGCGANNSLGTGAEGGTDTVTITANVTG